MKKKWFHPSELPDGNVIAVNDQGHEMIGKLSCWAVPGSKETRYACRSSHGTMDNVVLFKFIEFVEAPKPTIVDEMVVLLSSARHTMDRSDGLRKDIDKLLEEINANKP